MIAGRMIARPRRRLLVALRRLATCGGGSVAVEFAILAPLLVALLLGVIGMAQTMTVAVKVQQAAGSIADLVTQSKEVDTAALNGIVVAGQQIVYPFPAGAGVFGGRVICVRFDGTAPALVPRALWEYSFGAVPGAAPDLTTLVGLAQPGIDVILVSVEYRHQLTVPNPIFDSLTIRETAVSRPRVTTTIARK